MSLARRFGGAGIRRRTRAGVRRGIPADPRLAFAGIQSAFYVRPDEANASLISGEVDQLTDTIAQVDKADPEDAPYTIAAPAADDRPTLTANGTMTWAAASSGLVNIETGLGPRIDEAGEYSVYLVMPAYTSGCPWAIYEDSAVNAIAMDTSGENFRHRTRSDVGGFVAATFAQSAGVICFTGRAGDFVRAYVDGSLVATSAGVQDDIEDDLVRFQLGAFGGLAGLVGEIAEHTACIVQHSDAQVATYSAALQAYWEGRGVVFS